MADDPVVSFLASLPGPLCPLSKAEVDVQLAPLRAQIASALGEEALARLALPPPFSRFLEAAGGGQLEGPPTFWSLATMVRSTVAWLGHVDRKELYDPTIFDDGGPPGGRGESPAHSRLPSSALLAPPKLAVRPSTAAFRQSYPPADADPREMNVEPRTAFFEDFLER